MQLYAQFDYLLTISYCVKLYLLFLQPSAFLRLGAALFNAFNRLRATP